NREGLVAYDMSRDQHRVTVAELLLLPHVHHLDEVRDAADLFEKVELAGGLECRLELPAAIEEVLQRLLVVTGDEHNLGNARSDGALHYVLNNRLVDNRKHLFWDGLACG